ncbi:MAG: hypothetical protein WBF35_13595 [Candidatus Acidiferrales bacterium]
MYTCRQCDEEINQATEICPHCGTDLTIVPEGETPAKTPPSRRKRVIRWIVLLTVVFGSLWSFLWFVVSPRTGQPTVQAEQQALDSLTQVQAALASYSQVMSGAYPSTLDPLGAAVRVAAQRAQSFGYQMQYSPGPLASDGSIRSYALQATAGNHGYRSFYTDESGVVRATREERPASASDPPLAPAR